MSILINLLCMLDGMVHIEPAEAAVGTAVVLVQRVGTQFKVTLMAATCVPITSKVQGKSGSNNGMIEVME